MSYITARLEGLSHLSGAGQCPNQALLTLDCGSE